MLWHAQAPEEEQGDAAGTSSSLPLSQDLSPPFSLVLAPSNCLSPLPHLRVKWGIGGSLLWEGRGIGEPGLSLLGEEINLHLISGVPNTCYWRLIPWPQAVKVAKVPWSPAREERRKGGVGRMHS